MATLRMWLEAEPLMISSALSIVILASVTKSRVTTTLPHGRVMDKPPVQPAG